MQSTRFYPSQWAVVLNKWALIEMPTSMLIEIKVAIRFKINLNENQKTLNVYLLKQKVAVC